jgi:NADPH2:quinone reductase
MRMQIGLPAADCTGLIYNAAMKAIVVHEFGGPEVLKVEDVPAPSPTAGQALIRVRAIGVNPVDVYIRSGAYARKPALPYIPHTDISGSVESVGPGVTHVKPGDRVYAFDVTGGGAELAVVPEAQVQPLPATVSFAQGAAIGVPYATAWRALDRAQPAQGETVLVHGASGGVGIAAMQIARTRGMRVLGTAGTPEGLALVRQQGAEAVFNHREPGYEAQILAATGGRGVDVILEMLANVNLDRDLDLIALRGRVVVIGNRGRIEIDPRKTMSKDGVILGMTLFNVAPPQLAQIHAGIVAGLGHATLHPVTGQEFPLAEAPQAHAAVMAPGTAGKIILVP